MRGALESCRNEGGNVLGGRRASFLCVGALVGGCGAMVVVGGKN